MNKTGIEYLEYTWNPLAMRCTPVSEGCEHCWHLRMADRLARNPMIGDIPRMAYRGLEIPALDTDRLREPISLLKPARIGVQFMGDLFHDAVSTDVRDQIMATIALAQQHTFLLLTKRPKNMLAYFNTFDEYVLMDTDPYREALDRVECDDPDGAPKSYYMKTARLEEAISTTRESLDKMGYLPNLWLGVTVESDKYLWRIEELLKIRAAKRWVSIEPMLSDINLRRAFGSEGPRQTYIEQLDWVTLGGETGPGARPMHPAWVRSVRDQCQAAGVPFFFKGWGEWEKNSGIWGHNPYVKSVCAHGTRFERSGKKIAGRDLDGRTWDEMPEGGKP